MDVLERIAAFGQLGDVVRQLGLNERKALAEKAQNENAWFTEDSVALSLKGIEVLLDKDRLASWASAYSFTTGAPKVVGVAMAGNLPAVGFHDFLCVLMSGHQLKAKPSSQDSVLIKFLAQKLQEVSPELGARISFEDTLKNVDAMIATGSDNTARYFEYYFRNIPHIIRKNRASCAVLVGEEPAEELWLLGKDVFSYFGLGCRNVSKVFV
ncbi:MAG: acyl-CoA reductase, partial [Cyclobacteriaceae bacterium]|nr:acyl-CoA reductase [Cyclobacteriaceae bacterium]